MYTNKELKVLRKLAQKLFSRRFESLDRYDQDFVFSYAADYGMI